MQAGAIDEAGRTVEFSFSSEAPVDRWFGKEILSHAIGAADLGRLNNGGQCLFNHDMDDYVGVVEKAWIDPLEKKGYCIVRFSKNEEADVIFKDVVDGILRNVSFAYIVNEMVLLKQGQDGEDSEYLVTKFEVFEVSVVTIPADPSVGVGRDIDDENLKVLVSRAMEDFEKVNKKTAGPSPAKGEIKMEVQPADIKLAQENAVKTERERVGQISALCEKYKMSDLARQLIEGGKSIDEARSAVLEKIGAKASQTPVGTEAILGLTEREIKAFSFLKVMRAMMDPHDQKAREEAKFEFEVSDAAQKLTGKTARGVLIPFDILRQPLMNPSKRDLSVGVSTAGGDLVATNLLASSYVELLRNKSVLMAMGAQSLSGLVGNISIPRATGGGTAYWVGEAVDATESDQAFDQISMSPKTVGALTQYSRKLILQSSLDIESLVRNDLGAIIALEIDRVGLYGLGSSSQPLGIKGTSGINTTDFAADAPTWAEIVGLESKVNAANADVGAMAYLVNATERGVLKLTPKIGTTFPQFMMESNGEVNGYKCYMSNQSGSKDYWFGVWNQSMFGFWSGLDLLVDPYTGAKAGTVRIAAHQDMDFAVRHAPSFSRGNNTL